MGQLNSFAIVWGLLTGICSQSGHFGHGESHFRHHKCKWSDGSNMRIDFQGSRQSAIGSGFTLVEVMVGVLCMAVLFAALYLGLGQGFAIIQTARENLRATQVIQEQMETIRLYAWEQLTNGTVPASFTAGYDAADTLKTGRVYSGTIQVDLTPMGESYSNHHRLVTAGLSWTNGTSQRQKQMTTLISRSGLHNYYY